MAPLVENIQSLLRAYPQMLTVLLCDVVDAAKHLGVVDPYVGVVADVEQLVFATHPYTAVRRVAVHGLYVFLGNHRCGFHEACAVRTFVYDVYARRISTHKYGAWLHFTQGQEVVVGVGRLIHLRQQRMPLLVATAIHADTVVGGKPQVIALVLQYAVDAIVGERVAAQVRAS